MKALGSVAAVVEAIRADADAEEERLERETARAVETIRSGEKTPPDGSLERERRLEVARRDARELLAKEELAERRALLEERERWIGRVVAEARLRGGHAGRDDPEVRRRVLRLLASEALRHLDEGGGLKGSRSAELLVAPSDTGLLDAAWLSETAAVLGLEQISVTADAGAGPGGGCLARTADGRVVFDNRLEARARRFEPAWRAALGALYAS